MPKNTLMCYDGPSIFGKNFYFNQMSYALFTTDLTSFLAFSVKANKHIHEGPLLDTIVTTLHFFNTQTTLIFHLQKPYFWDCCLQKRKRQNELFSLVIVDKHCEIWKNAATHAKPVLIISMNCIGNIHMVVACM